MCERERESKLKHWPFLLDATFCHVCISSHFVQCGLSSPAHNHCPKELLPHNGPFSRISDLGPRELSQSLSSESCKDTVWSCCQSGLAHLQVHSERCKNKQVCRGIDGGRGVWQCSRAWLPVVLFLSVTRQPSILVYLSPGAAVAKCHKLDGLKQQRLVSFSCSGC